MYIRALRLDTYTYKSILQEENAEGSETVGKIVHEKSVFLFMEIEKEAKKKRRSGPLRGNVSEIYGFT